MIRNTFLALLFLLLLITPSKALAGCCENTQTLRCDPDIHNADDCLNKGRFWRWLPDPFECAEEQKGVYKCMYCHPQGCPTLAQWGLIILVLLMAGTGVLIMLRRRKVTAS